MKTFQLLTSIALGFLVIQPAWAASPQAGAPQQFAPRVGGAVAPLIENQAVPQFNDPGPQISLPAPGNPVQQLAPLGSSPQPDSLGIR